MNAPLAHDKLMRIYFWTPRGSGRIAFCVGFISGDPALSSPRVTQSFRLFWLRWQGRICPTGCKRVQPEFSELGTRMSPEPAGWKPALHVAQTFLSAGSGDFPVARLSATFNHTGCKPPDARTAPKTVREERSFPSRNKKHRQTPRICNAIGEERIPGHSLTRRSGYRRQVGRAANKSLPRSRSQ